MLGKRLLSSIGRLEASFVDFVLRLKNQKSPIFQAADHVSNALIFRMNRNEIDAMSLETVSRPLDSGEKLRVVRLFPSHASELLDLLRTGFSEEALAHLKLQDVNAARLERLMRIRAHLYYGVFVDERLVGYGTLKLFFGGQAYLVFAVEEAWRRKGVASVLVRFMVDVAIKKEYKVRAFVDRDNVASYRLLSKLGCKEAQVTEDHFVMEGRR